MEPLGRLGERHVRSDVLIGSGLTPDQEEAVVAVVAATASFMNDERYVHDYHVDMNILVPVQCNP